MGRELAGVALLFVISLARPAGAQDAATAAAAQALYDKASAEMDKKDYASACPKLEDVTRMMPNVVGARITLGECYEGAGKLASAWSAYSAAEATAIRIGQPERAEKGHHAAELLRPKLATMTIVVPEGLKALAGLSIHRDGLPVGEGSWSVAIPVDRGSHAIEVTATAKLPWKRQAEVASDGAKVTVTIEALVDAPAPPSGAATPGADQPRPGESRTSPLVYIGFGAAGVGLGVGVVTGLMTLSKSSSCKTTGGCTSDALSSAKTLAWISDIGFGVGIAGAGLGVAGIALSGKPKRSGATVLHVGLGGASVEGSF